MQKAAAFLTVLVLCAMPGLAQGTPDGFRQGGVKAFADWTVTCDPALTCWAQAFDEATMVWLTLQRDAGPDAKLTAVLGLPGLTKYDDVDFDVDGFQAVFAGAENRADADLGPRLAVAPERIPLLVDALRKAGSLTAKGAEEGDPDPSISLKGAAAALRFVDDVQDRVGTVTAAVATGPKAAGTVPQARALAVIEAPRQHAASLKSPPDPAVAKAGKDACAAAGEDDAISDDTVTPEGYRLDDGREIWFIACFNGPYNYVYAGLLKDHDRLAPLAFVRPPGIGDDETALLWNPETNADQPGTPFTLKTFGKNRGMGDCGTIANYVWTGEAFSLVDYRKMAACAGQWDDEWPVIWQATVEGR